MGSFFAPETDMIFGDGVGASVNGYIPLGVPHIAYFDVTMPEGTFFFHEEKQILWTEGFRCKRWHFEKIWSLLRPLRNLLILEAVTWLFGGK